jgi:hypothetical protein
MYIGSQRGTRSWYMIDTFLHLEATKHFVSLFEDIEETLEDTHVNQQNPK